MKRTWIVLVVVLAGCDGAHRDHGDTPDGGMDPVTCGSVTCDQIPPAACVDGDTLREYSAACTDATCSYPSTDTECGAAGCCGDHCCEVAASNADVTGTIMPTGLNVAPPNGTFDTDTECVATAALGTCAVVARTDLPEACVCRMDELTIGTLEIKGSRALVLLAYKTVRVQTTLDVSGDKQVAGPGARGKVYTTNRANSGGSGGSFATKGGTGSDGVASADVYGDATLIPLFGGTDGMDAATTSIGAGGGGGGALQITAGVKIEIPGKIYAGGGGGVGGYSSWGNAGGGGGGSGGAILLEAPTIMMTGRLDANGGGGAAAGGDDYYGVDGEDASDEMPSGGYANDNGTGCALDGYIYGGNGGNGATSTTAAGNGTSGGYHGGCFPDSFIGGGGGGGGAGRIRINTTSGCQCSGTVSPSASFGTLGVK